MEAGLSAELQNRDTKTSKPQRQEFKIPEALTQVMRLGTAKQIYSKCVECLSEMDRINEQERREIDLQYLGLPQVTKQFQQVSCIYA